MNESDSSDADVNSNLWSLSAFQVAIKESKGEGSKLGDTTSNVCKLDSVILVATGLG